MAETATALKQYTVPRDGQRNLTFRGEIIADHSGRFHNGKEASRFTMLTLYKTQGGKYILHSEYITYWQGEDSRDQAEICETPAEVFAALTRDDSGEGSGLSWLEKALLEEAEKCDPAFEGILSEEIL